MGGPYRINSKFDFCPSIHRGGFGHTPDILIANDIGKVNTYHVIPTMA